MVQKIMVVEDDAYAAQAVVDLLSPKYEVYPALTTDAMSALLEQHKFDLVVLDLALGKSGHGIDWVERIHKTGAKVLVLTTQEDQPSIFACLRAAVAGILPKQDGPAYLLPAVDGVLAGYNMSSSDLIAQYADPRNRLPRMSRQEIKLINYLYAYPHASNAEAGAYMHLSEGTIKNKLARLFQKFDVHKRGLLLEEARRRGHRPVEPDEAEMASGGEGLSEMEDVA